MTIPIVGWGDGSGTFTVDTYDISYSPNTYKLTEPIKVLAIRSIDELVAQGGKGEARPYLAAKWLRMKGYTRPIEFEKYHWLFGRVIDEVTATGLEFHRRHAAPIGEW